VVNSDPGTEFEFTATYYSFYYLGLIALQNGNYEDAIVYLERAKMYVGFDLEIAKTLGLIYSQLLYFEDAERSYSEIPGNMLTKEIVDPYIGVMLVNGSEKLDEIASDFYYNSTFAKAVKNYLRGNYTNALRELERIPADSSVLYYSHYLKYLIYSQDAANADNALKEAFVLG
jgi:tetratricopeptide (TPR) repeat protein